MQKDERIDLTAQNAPRIVDPRTLSRREFVRTLTAATAGTGILTAAFAGCALTPSQRAEATEAALDKIGKMPKVKLGNRMGNMQVSQVVMSSDWNRSLYGPALAAGVNFVHKAGYWNEMPEEFKKVPRESYYTDITVDSTPNNPDDEEGAYRQVVDSLKRNGLGYYDIYRCHYGWHSIKDMKEKRGTHRAFDRLKKEGKVKYFGASQHGIPGDGGYERYEEMIAAQIEEGLIASYQVFFSYGKPQSIHDIFEKARKAGIGMCAMKTFAHGSGKMRGDAAKMTELKSPDMVGRSCVRYALSAKGSDGKPIFQCAVSAISNFDLFEENMGAAGTKIAAADGFIIHA